MKTQVKIFSIFITLILASCLSRQVAVNITPTLRISSATPFYPTVMPTVTAAVTLQPEVDLSCDEVNNTPKTNDIVEFQNGHLTKISSLDFNGKTVNFSPDGMKLAYANGDGVRIYSVLDGNLLCLLPSQSGVWSAVFSPDGKHLASLDGNSELKLWNIQDGSSRVLQSPNEAGMMWTVSTKGLAFTGDGSEILVWTDTYPNLQAFKILEADTGTLIAEIPNNSSPSANTVAISHDGKYLAIGSDKSLWVIDVETQATIYVAEDSRRIGSLQFSPNDEYIYAVDWLNGEIVIWNAETGKKFKTINTCVDCELPQDAYVRFAVTKNGEQIAAIQNVSRINLWSTVSWQMQSNFRAKGALIYDVAMSQDGTKLAARIWYPRDVQPENAIYIWYLEQ